MAATTSQPISLPIHGQDQQFQDVSMSMMSSGGSFNPASYTRHFLDSPLSWRDSSFGMRYPTGISPMHGSYE
jgi:transcription factor SFP1